MKSKIVLLSIAAIIVTVVALYFGLSATFWNNNEEEADFSQAGYLIRNNPGLVPGVWYLTYEEPGKPGLVKQLQFDSASACAVNAPAAPCDPSILEEGTRVRVEGIQKEEIVLVRTIQSPELPPIDISATSSPATGTTTGTSTVPAATSTRPPAGTSTATSTGTSTGQNPANGLTIKLYYYDPAKDLGPGGAQCGRAGLVAVERVIQRSNTPLQDTIRLLIRGELSAQERARGITTEFPLPGLTLESASNKKGTLTLSFNDPQNETSGGSCRVSILWSQIEATARQFPGVQIVRFKPESLFQP